MSDLSVSVELDDKTIEVARSFDYDFDGTTTFTPPEINGLPEEWGVGLIVGSSGSGKTTLLSSFGSIDSPSWEDNRSLVYHFESADDAKNRLSAVGLNSIPSILRPYRVLSNGERHRADIARVIRSGAVIDEFTSVVDRTVARSISVSVRRYINNSDINRVVIASCHRDIIEWLEPDWVFDTDSLELTRGYKKRPQLIFDLYSTTKDAWRIFRQHHYLNSSILPSSRCFILLYEGTPVAFCAAIPMPSGTLKNAWRGHRTVVLPDWQGMGIGNRLSDTIGWIHIKSGKRYYSKTAHYRMGGYRTSSPYWRETVKNNKKRNLWAHGPKGPGDTNRVCFSHEYIGNKPDFFIEK